MYEPILYFTFTLNLTPAWPVHEAFIESRLFSSLLIEEARRFSDEDSRRSKREQFPRRLAEPSTQTTMTQAETFTTLSRVITALQAGEALSKDLWLDDARKPDVYVLDDLRSLFPSRIDFLRFIN